MSDSVTQTTQSSDTLSKFHVSEDVKKQILDWFQVDNSSLLMISGGSGTGKTTLGRQILPLWLECNAVYISQFQIKKKTEIQSYLKQRLSNVDISFLYKENLPKKTLVVFDDTHTIMTSSDKSWFMNYISELKQLPYVKILLLSKQISTRNLHLLRKDVVLIEIYNLTQENTIQITNICS